MSGAYCRNPNAKTASGEAYAYEGKSPDDFPCIFNPYGGEYFDWGAAFPSTLHTVGTVFLFVSGIAFIACVIAFDAMPDEVLAVMLIWTGLQFVPYIAALVLMNGPNPIKGLFLNLVYRPDLPPVGINAAPWAVRSANAQKENTTALTIFAPAVLLFYIRAASDVDEIKVLCWVFLIFRVIHYMFLVGPIGSPQPFSALPTIGFLGSIFCSIAILLLALTKSSAINNASTLIQDAVVPEAAFL